MVIKRPLSLTHPCTLLLSDNRDRDAERSEGDLKDTGRVHVERDCAGKRSSKGKVLEAAPRGRLGPEEGDQMHRQAMLTGLCQAVMRSVGITLSRKGSHRRPVQGDVSQSMSKGEGHSCCWVKSDMQVAERKKENWSWG